jgi:hypothetical protein
MTIIQQLAKKRQNMSTNMLFVLFVAFVCKHVTMSLMTVDANEGMTKLKSKMDMKSSNTEKGMRKMKSSKGGILDDCTFSLLKDTTYDVAYAFSVYNCRHPAD